METRKNRQKKQLSPIGMIFILVLMLGLGCVFLKAISTTNEGLGVMTDAAAKEEALLLQQQEERDALLETVNRLYGSYDYDEAEALLADADVLHDEEIQLLREKIKLARSQLVKYEGKVHHIFFHSLIVYPELAFDGDDRSQGYNMWMTTRDEFVAMLPKLHERGYVLYDIQDLTKKNADGQMVAQEIYLPAGKTPLILSIDDVCYYDYMKKDGFADRLSINKAGDVVTIVKDSEGNEHETYDGDVMPIVDQYVRAHPDFSYQGAKGIVAVTGYQGAFGYRITDLEGAALEAAMDTTRQIAQCLKENGWHIANHSYTHNSYFRDGTVTMKQLTHDTERWQKLIAPAVGKTNIFISPFGMHLKENDPRFRYLVEQGYDIYCPVGASMGMTINNDNMIHNRLNLDGYTMIKKPDLVKELYFDVQEVLDPLRPPL